MTLGECPLTFPPVKIRARTSQTPKKRASDNPRDRRDVPRFIPPNVRLRKPGNVPSVPKPPKMNSENEFEGAPS
jgi:hypothetical protein